MRGGYLYAMKYDRKGVYKINANNSADITLISFGFTSNFSGGDNYGYVQMYKIGDRILGSDFNICSDDTILRIHRLHQMRQLRCKLPLPVRRSQGWHPHPLLVLHRAKEQVPELSDPGRNHEGTGH